jgi:Zn finger protein HypA/HybF involved in hydrogenase expression
MHESIRAKEIENKIYEAAREKGVDNISKITIKIGRGEGESRQIIEHLIKEHMNVKDLQIIEEDVVLSCYRCGLIIAEHTGSIRCPECNSPRINIAGGMGVEVLNIE